MKMMNTLKATLMASVLLLPIAACSQSDAGEKEFMGGLLGAAVGGLAGAQIGKGTGQLAATAGGAILGGLIGMEAGKSLDKADRMYATRSYSQAMERNPTGTSTGWSNPDSGNYGTVTPTRTYQQSSGRYCREFIQTVTVAGSKQQMYGTACRQPDGSWEIVN